MVNLATIRKSSLQRSYEDERKKQKNVSSVHYDCPWPAAAAAAEDTLYLYRFENPTQLAKLASSSAPPL